MKKMIIRPRMLKGLDLNNTVWLLSYENVLIQVPPISKKYLCKILKITDRDLRQHATNLMFLFNSALLSFTEYIDCTVSGSPNNLVLLGCNKISRKTVIREEMRAVRDKNKVSIMTQDNPVMVVVLMLILSFVLWFALGN